MKNSANSSLASIRTRSSWYSEGDNSVVVDDCVPEYFISWISLIDLKMRSAWDFRGLRAWARARRRFIEAMMLSPKGRKRQYTSSFDTGEKYSEVLLTLDSMEDDFNEVASRSTGSDFGTLRVEAPVGNEPFNKRWS